jgi:hypothetical protein
MTTSAEEHLNYLVDKMTCSVNTSQPLSWATIVIFQLAHEQRYHGGRNEGYTHAQHHGLPLAKAKLAVANTDP